MNNVNTTNKLVQDKTFLKKAYNAALIPCMLTILSGCVNIIADGIIVGQKAGANGLAAINLCIPVYLVLCIIGSFFVSGTAIPASQSIGSDNSEEAQKYYGSALTTCLISSAAAMLVGIFLTGPISGLLCSDDGIRPMVHDYTLVTLIGAAPKILIYIPFWFLRIDGKNKTVTLMMTVMGIGNVILDIVFMFLLNMGILGAALASVIATAAACILGFYGLHRKPSSFTLKPALPNKKQWSKIAATGSPAAINNLMQTVKLLFVNYVLAKYGGNDALAIFSVLNGITTFSDAVTVGVPQAGSAMLGVYHGEHDIKSLRIVIHLEFLSGIILSALFGIVITAGADIISTAYGIGLPMFIPMLCLAVSLYPALVNSILSTFYSISSHPMLSNMIITLRSFVFAAVTIFGFCLAGHIPWLFLPTAELLTLAVWFVVSGIACRKKKNTSRFLLEDISLEDSGKVINFSLTGETEDICSASERITDFCGENGMNPKQTMRISLAIEEMLTLITQENKDAKINFDIRVFATDDIIGIRIRYNGIDFDPLSGDENDDKFMGIMIIKKLVKSTVYKRVLGLNTLIILI